MIDPASSAGDTAGAGGTPAAMNSRGGPSPRLLLGVLVVAQFMVVLDAAIVSVALPSIQRSLGFTQAELAWVIDAYILIFGGFLLLGGRAADLFGRKTMFLTGLSLFGAASLACGLATGSTELIVFRAVQGLGAAILSPAALSIVTTTFTEPEARNKALGVWGGIAGVAAAGGVLAGGLLTATAGWRWVFYVNVPVVVALLFASRLLPAGARPTRRARLDLPGGVLVTAGLCLGIYAVFEAPQTGWTSARTLGSLAATLVLLAGFVAWERRSAEPLVPLEVFRLPGVSGANAVNVLVGAGLFSTFFFLTLYFQHVLGYGALKTGLAELPLCVAQVVAARAAVPLAGRFGPRFPLAAALVIMAGSLLWFAQLGPHATYTANVLTPSVAFGAGLSVALVMTFIAGQHGVPGPLAGLASGLINTTLNIGGALGLALLGVIAAARTKTVLDQSSHPGSTSLSHALAAGYRTGWTVAAAMAFTGAVVAVVVLKNRTGKHPPHPAPHPRPDPYVSRPHPQHPTSRNDQR